MIRMRVLPLGTLLFWSVLPGMMCGAEVSNRKPKASDPAEHSFPAIGISAQRKVNVEWNRFYDHAGLGGILARIHAAFPKLKKLDSVGRSVEGRERRP